MKIFPTVLFDVENEEVSLVDRGANKKKPFPITKAEKTHMKNFEEILKAVLETEVENEKLLLTYLDKQNLSEKGADAVKAALRLLSAFKEEIPESAFNELNKLLGIKLESPNDDDKDKKLTKAEMVSKMPEDVRKQFEAQQKELEEASAALKSSNERIEKMEQKARLGEWKNKVEKSCAFYPGVSIDDLAKELLDLENVNPDLATKYFDRMKGVSETLSKSKLLDDIGLNNGQHVEESAAKKIEKLAKEIMTKESISYADAYSKALTDNPELYEQFAKENPEQYQG